MRKNLTILSLCFLPLGIRAANLPLQYANNVYEPQIKTVLLTQDGSTERFPVVRLNGNSMLKLQFDELKASNDFYQYTFVHCSANWEPSDLLPNEYLVGNFFENVNDYSFSNNTFQSYTHYEIKFPSDEIRPKYSGNYILKVYRNFDESDIVITWRFMVVDDKFVIDATARSATNVDKRFNSHEIDFSVNIGDYSIPNPFLDVNAVVVQNMRWDNAKFGLKPRFVNNKIYSFNYEIENVFLGGNEFRSFDIRSLRFLSQNVQKKYIQDNMKYVELYADRPRSAMGYLQFADFNGKSVFDNRDGNNGETEGDYAWVKFILQSPTGKLDKDPYIFGEFTYWKVSDEFKMNYNEETKQYEKWVLLKQAYFNYIYVFKDDNGLTDNELIEGNYFQTENDYYIMVYHKNQFMRYDELLAVHFVNSRNTN